MLKKTYKMHFLAEIKIETKISMLVLFETPAGYAVLLDEGKLAKSDSLYEDFETIYKAKNVVKLKTFQKFVLPLRHLELPQLWVREICPRL